MKGFNKLEINHDTMLEVVQLWLEKSFKEAPTVKDVSWRLAGNQKIFIIHVSERKADA